MATQIQIQSRGVAMGSRANARPKALYYLSFLQMAIGGMISVAVANILIFTLNVTTAFYGAYCAIYSIAFVLGPIFLRKRLEHLGIRLAITSTIGLSVLSIMIELYYLTPITALLVSAIEGIYMAVFWVNIDTLISRWQAYSNEATKAAIFRHYSYSWNLGGLAGGIIGFVIAFFMQDDYGILGFCLILAIIQIPIALKLKEPPIFISSANEIQKIRKNKRQIIGVSIPITIAYLVGILYLFTKEVYNVSFPYLLYDSNASSQWLYLNGFLMQLSQMGGIAWASHKNFKRKKRNAFLSLGLMMVITFFVVASSWQVAFVAMIGIALLSGVTYDFVTQLVFKYAAEEKSLKHLTVYQSVSAIGSIISPMIAGLLGEKGISYNFQLIIATLALGLMVLSLVKRNADSIYMVENVDSMKSILTSESTFYLPRHILMVSSIVKGHIRDVLEMSFDQHRL